MGVGGSEGGCSSSQAGFALKVERRCVAPQPHVQILCAFFFFFNFWDACSLLIKRKHLCVISDVTRKKGQILKSGA